MRGTTVLEVFVSETGEVEHVVTVRGLPLGIDDANEASLRTWRFRPFELDGASTRVVGTVALSFACVETRGPS